jgi:hypothetical protein
VNRLSFSCSYKVTRLYSPSPLECQLHIQELRGPTHFNYQFLFDTASTALMASSVYHLDLVAGGSGGGDGNAFLVSLSSLYIRSGATSKSVASASGSNPNVKTTTTNSMPRVFLSILPVVEKLSLIIVNGTLVPSNSTPQRSYCPLSISYHDSCYDYYNLRYRLLYIEYHCNVPKTKRGTNWSSSSHRQRTYPNPHNNATRFHE